ncbi:MAG TPA: hypothetical protein PKX07_16820 [Aggregatilineales bacterium]|nr:hypothetical protein [Aggregatilineales bacterium]
MTDRTPQSARISSGVSEAPFARKLTLPDGVLLGVSLAFIAIVAIDFIARFPDAGVYPVLKHLHYNLSRYGLIVSGVMLVIAIAVGIVRKGDVKPWFRRGVFVVVATMLIQVLIGLYLMYGLNIPSGKPEHIIYGFGALLSLPFFVFVEVTAKKRPAMGSYIWGFALMLGILIRAIGTGPAG